jgi:hypothetical protein
MWGMVILAGAALLAAGAAWINAETPRGALVFVLVCGTLNLLGCSYLFLGAQSAAQALQAAGLFTVVGFGSGGWLLSLGSLGSVIGAYIQLRSD